jgi:hypothetical protein
MMAMSSGSKTPRGSRAWPTVRLLCRLSSPVVGTGRDRNACLFGRRAAANPAGHSSGPSVFELPGVTPTLGAASSEKLSGKRGVVLAGAAAMLGRLHLQ